MQGYSYDIPEGERNCCKKKKKPIVTPTSVKKKNRCSDSPYCIASSLLKFLYHKKIK